MNELLSQALQLSALALVTTAATMFALWLAAVKTDNYSYVDVGWALNFTLIAVIYGLLGDGFWPRKLLIAGMYTFWSLRLGIYLAQRVIGKPEEERYARLRQDWGTGLAAKFLLFYEFQAVLNVVLAVPMLLACLNPEPRLGLFEYLGLAIFAAAIAGETVADRQLAAFKKNPANRGLVCQQGLWRYSRHPNYFFEWVIWIGYAIFALGSPGGWIALPMPALMLHFLLNVTGVKPTEEQALRSKGDLYREYQKTTSAFVPWFPRRPEN